MGFEENDDKQKDAPAATNDSLGLAIGLSLGVLFGIVMDNIGFGMIAGVALGLGGSAAVSLLGKKKREEDHEEAQ